MRKCQACTYKQFRPPASTEPNPTQLCGAAGVTSIPPASPSSQKRRILSSLPPPLRRPHVRWGRARPRGRRRLDDGAWVPPPVLLLLLLPARTRTGSQPQLRRQWVVWADRRPARRGSRGGPRLLFSFPFSFLFPSFSLPLQAFSKTVSTARVVCFCLITPTGSTYYFPYAISLSLKLFSVSHLLVISDHKFSS